MHAIPEEFSYCAEYPWAAEPHDVEYARSSFLVTMNTVFYSDIDTFLAGSATTVSFTEFFTGGHDPSPLSTGPGF